jgi:hypothetical protein
MVKAASEKGGGNFSRGFIHIHEWQAMAVSVAAFCATNEATERRRNEL